MKLLEVLPLLLILVVQKYSANVIKGELLIYIFYAQTLATSTW